MKISTNEIALEEAFRMKKQREQLSLFMFHFPQITGAKNTMDARIPESW